MFPNIKVEAGRHDGLPHFEEISPLRRGLLIAPLLAACPLALSSLGARASKIDPAETKVLPPDQMKWSGWLKGFPPQSAEMAKLYGDPNGSGPYLVLMKWYPGYMSAPHDYATGRICMVISGTWWVNSGADFDPSQTVPAGPGSFVERKARTPHYDGVKAGAAGPAEIAIFGIGPIELRLVEAGKPGWRKV